MSGRPRRALLVTATVLLVLGACGADGPEDAGPGSMTVPRRELYGVTAEPLDGELWVHGGIAGPAGSSPPVTSNVPPGWGPNTEVTVYGPDGAVRRRLTLPADLDGAIVAGHVLADGGTHFLIGTLCAGAGGCGTQVEPVLFRLDGDRGERVRLDLPPADFGHDAGVTMLTPIGHTSGTAWVLQLVESQGQGRGYGGYADRYRLLAIDLESGAGTEIALPEDVYGAELVCMDRETIFAAQAVVDAGPHLSQVRVLRRPATVSPGSWQPLAVLPFDRAASTGSLQCVSELSALVLAVGQLPTELFTLSMADGGETAPRSTLPGGPGYLLGVVDGAAVSLATAVESYDRTLWRHVPGAPWMEYVPQDLPERFPADARQPVYLRVLDGRLYDLQPITEASGAGTGRPVPIDL